MGINYGKKNAYYIKMIASFIMPIIIFFTKPLGMSLRQSFLSAVLVLIITWWSTKQVSKNVASCILLIVFAVFGKVPLKTVFSFPLSETFVLILLTYLFSQGIKNSKLAERILEPILSKYVDTPLKAFGSIILVFLIAIYVIPQPLARLIIVASIYKNYLEKTNISKASLSIIMLAIYNFYVAVNMVALDADIILNSSVAEFAGVSITNGQWMGYMAVPALIFTLVLIAVISVIFRKEVFGVRFQVNHMDKLPPLDKKDKLTSIVILGTVALWLVIGLMGGMLPFSISPTMVTLIGTLLLFTIGNLRLKDFKAIDITTMIFITAAFSIGGVLRASGIADIVFSKVALMFTDSYSLLYILTVVLASMGMHLILGSNTTTLSVIVPGFVIIGSGIISDKATMFLCYTSLACHYILPFHSVGMMIGNANNHFNTKHMVRCGLTVMVTIIISIFVLFLPWWHFTGLL